MTIHLKASMSNFCCLVLVLPVLVLGNVVSTPINTGITSEDVEQINALVQLSESLEATGELPVLRSSLEITEDQVSFYVYNKNNENSTAILLSQSETITSLTDFDISLPTVVLVHGWHATYNTSFPLEAGRKYMSLSNANVISVNWDETAQLDYLEAYAAVSNIGKYLGQLLQDISATYDYSLDKVTLVGHSLGAHIAGFAGKETNGTIHTIIGLDPAGPLFFQINPSGRLNQGDAQYIQVIHTNAGFLGANYNLGDSDFWPNGGKSQPGCGTDLTGSCAHSRSHEYFTESLTSNGFVAKFCDSYAYYTEGDCENTQSAVMGGASPNTGIEGTYYLDTNSESPFALGDVNS